MNSFFLKIQNLENQLNQICTKYQTGPMSCRTVETLLSRSCKLSTWEISADNNTQPGPHWTDEERSWTKSTKAKRRPPVSRPTLSWCSFLCSWRPSCFSHNWIASGWRRPPSKTWSWSIIMIYDKGSTNNNNSVASIIFSCSQLREATNQVQSLWSSTTLHLQHHIRTCKHFHPRRI